uniref:Chalcone-flavonone isomerase family protein n=1 Tax=Rhizophora mucronata TaxID=61149 RepID=A0A2P2PL24_RHIMU
MTNSQKVKTSKRFITCSYPDSVASLPQLQYFLLKMSDNLEAKLCFASGETPCLPIIDSNTASESNLFSINEFSTSGCDPSFEKLIAKDPWGN